MNVIETVREMYTNTVTTGAALEDYLVAAILFVVIGVAVSVGAYITSTVAGQIGLQTNTCTAGNTVNSATGLCGAGVTGLSPAYNAAGQAVTGMGTFAQWLPILAIVIVAVVIIALLYGFLVGGGRSAEAVVA